MLQLSINGILITILIAVLFVPIVKALKIYLNEHRYCKWVKKDKIIIIEKSTGKEKTFETVILKRPDGLVVNGQTKKYSPKYLRTSKFLYVVYYVSDQKLLKDFTKKYELSFDADKYEIKSEEKSL